MTMFGHFPDDLYQQFVQDYAERQAMAIGYPQQTFADKDKMPCNKPHRTPDHPTKKSVVKGCENGKEAVVRFGDQKMKIKKNIPERRANFRARHGCDEKKSKLSAGYWSCKAW
jgi:hypothetical protein